MEIGGKDDLGMLSVLLLAECESRRLLVTFTENEFLLETISSIR